MRPCGGCTDERIPRDQGGEMNSAGNAGKYLMQEPPRPMTNGERLADGMTKREAFAMAAMQGIRTTMVRGHADYRDVAQMAVDQADALLAALEKPR